MPCDVVEVARDRGQDPQACNVRPGAGLALLLILFAALWRIRPRKVRRLAVVAQLD